MTANEYTAALNALQLSQASAAKLLGIGLRTSNGYANGRPIPRSIQLLLELMIKYKIDPETLT